MEVLSFATWQQANLCPWLKEYGIWGLSEKTSKQNTKGACTQKQELMVWKVNVVLLIDEF